MSQIVKTAATAAEAGCQRALVLSSGGLDSSTCVAVAVDELGAENISSVSFFYGQRHDKELVAAEMIAEHYKIGHRVLDIGAILAESDNALMAGSDKEIPHGAYSEQIESDGKVSTYVPFRNGLMLSAAAALAMSIYPDQNVALYLGAHADDAAGEAYPDCSPEFTDMMGSAISIGTYGCIRLVAPFVNSHKADIVATGLRLNVPYELTWSCYEGEEKACGKCGTCIDRLEAFRANGATDPLDYE